MKEQNRILWKRRIKENISERNLLKSNICAEPKGRVAIGNSEAKKKEGRVSRRGTSKCESSQVQKKSLEHSGNQLVHNEQENKMRLES